ncbi:PDDEXK nuclease domain-containing protein [Arthrobacter alkaliphilus]|uniref:PDDEXK nuclease domain-containing protein n=1 Tax=Arthrobacter alkaliphilus TaxID=369936 RepID=UPI0027E1E5F9|nr:PDDEXK nuclease domain-containing protein [Arthrobacter alkaliphilus]
MDDFGRSHRRTRASGSTHRPGNLLYLEFPGLSGEVAERDLENAFTETLRQLGPGFSFGGQVHFGVEGDAYYVDLLFFHMDQNRYFVVEMRFALRATSSRAGMGRLRP